MMEYQITTERLSKKYKNFKAVDHVSPHIRKGKIYGFLGPNGAGKSTTMKMPCWASRRPAADRLRLTACASRRIESRFSSGSDRSSNRRRITPI